jgi:outer membrane protein
VHRRRITAPSPEPGRIGRAADVGDIAMTSRSALFAGVAACLILCAPAAPALAQTGWQAPKAGEWLVSGRVTDVFSGADDAVVTAAGAATGLNVDVGDSVMPTLGFTYFLTDHWAIEGILGTTRHEIRARGGATDVAVHETWVLPPVVTLQYRPVTGRGFSPYVGAGVNAMVFYGGDDRNGFSVDLDDGFGYAAQAGVDVGLNADWSLNLDVKKVWFNTGADINNGALKSDVALDPWVVSLGLSRKF